MHVSVYKAKTQLSKLLEMVQGGEDIVIERHGKPVARLVPVREKVKSPLGMMRGEFEMVEGWERPLTNEEADAFWEGRR
jgi:prevent-host-death family protein